MANIHWGVDSAAAVTHKVAVEGNKHQTLYEFVVSKLQREPEFWGAYVGGRYEVTAEQLAYISKASQGKCRILVVYNGAHNSKNSVQGNYQCGVTDARKAINAASRVGVPGGVMIWSDVEGAWTPTADWFLGWFDTMYDSKYSGRGGIYCRPNIEQFYKPYVEALKRSFAESDSGNGSPGFPVTQPFGSARVGSSVATVAPTWQRTAATSTLNKKPLSDTTYFMPPDPPGKMRLLWGTRPQKREWKNPATDSFVFNPSNPPPLPGRVALWQYHIDFLKPTSTSQYGLIDMDLADDRAYNLMWRL